MKSSNIISQKNAGRLTLIDRPHTFLCITLCSAIALMSFQYQAAAQEGSSLKITGPLETGAELTIAPGSQSLKVLLVTDASRDMEITDWPATKASLEHGHYSSRLPGADYRENRVNPGLEVSS